MLKKILQTSIFNREGVKKFTNSGLSRSYRVRKGLNRKFKEKKKKSSVSDEKLIKLTKKEDLEAREKREREMRERRDLRVHLSKKFDHQLEFQLNPEFFEKFRKVRKRFIYDFEKNPQGMYDLFNKTVSEYLKDQEKKKQGHKFLSEKAVEEKYSPINTHSYKELEDKENQDRFVFKNVEDDINSKYFMKSQIVPHEVKGTKRCGALGKKVGMIHVYDSWGVMNPVTVIHIDRCQVTQVFTEEANGFNALQVGMGQKSFKNLRKSEIGHFLKAKVPPKINLKQYNVDPENLLPLGFMIGPRHFTPGQFVDIKAKAKNKGFSGAVKRWGFGGQSASHGTTKTHRSLGSTGQCQDAGRVFKGKRMHGHMGGHPTVMRNLKVFRVDHERSLVYLTGSVPGRKGEIVEIYDSFLKDRENSEMVNYPTFVPKEGAKYANVVQMEADEQDPNEVYLHDEALPKDDEED